MKLFLVIFALVILFVIGSASMMRFFDNKQLMNNQKLKDDGKKEARENEKQDELDNS